jgi:hypothetical protein
MNLRLWSSEIESKRAKVEEKERELAAVTEALSRALDKK